MRTHPYFIILLVLTIFGSTNTFAQRTKKVAATMTLPLEDSHCVGSFKQDLLRQTQIKALAKEFGTIVQQGNDLTVTNKENGFEASSGTELTTLTSSEVKGEWISTTESSFEWILKQEGGKQVVYLKCSVEGKARAIDDTPIGFTASTLSCNQTGNCETTTFQDMQSLYVGFQSPVNGYMSIFMREKDKVYRLFPYSSTNGEKGNAAEVKADQEYIVFSPEHATEMGISPRIVDELQLTTMGEDRLFNRVYVVFSPKPYKKPILDEENGGLKTLSPEDFEKWLSKNKGMNKEFQDKIIYISVAK
ncbi:hypothetical protein V6R21_18570 [Limibacter armeniacum]|uniref:hypothetical protein n=1 Tax=Limibacter armeniacum TaxID=466084 RepID=UPI002FE56A1F